MNGEPQPAADKRARHKAVRFGLAGVVANTAIVFVLSFVVSWLGYGALEIIAGVHGLVGASVGTMIAVIKSPAANPRRILLAFAVNDLIALVSIAGMISIVPTVGIEIWLLILIVCWSILMGVSAIIASLLLRPGQPVAENAFPPTEPDARKPGLR